MDVDGLDCLLSRLDWLYDAVVRYLDVDERIVDGIRETRDCLRCLSVGGSYSLCQADKVFTGERGRPKLNIPQDQLEFLVEKKFKVREMALLFGTSTRTIERRLCEFGLSIGATYAELSDAQLDAVIGDIVRDFPNVGYKRLTGLLQARGLRVQQSRIRESMRRVNPEGTLLRALELNVIRRRRYHVGGTLSLWHIDGNHKLIR